MGLVFHSPQLRFIPTPRLKIDSTHPLANGLIACYLPGISFNNLTGRGADLGYLSSTGTSARFSVGSEGPGWLKDGSDDSGIYNAALPPLFTTITKISIYTRFLPLVNSDPYPTFFGIDYDSTSANDPYYVFNLRAGFAGSTANTNELVWNSGGVGTAVVATMPQLTNGVVASFGATGLVGGNVNGYFNGLLAPGFPIAFGASSPGTSATSCMTIGAASNTTRHSNAVTFCAYMWNRDLSANEMAMLDADPYGFLVPDEGEWPAVAAVAARYAGFSTPQHSLSQVVRRMVSY